MTWWTCGRFLGAAAVVLLPALAGGCGGNGGADEPSPPDAQSDLVCERATDGGEESFDLSLGVRSGEDEQDFVELTDGDPAPLVLGFQGLYMLLLSSEASLPIDSEEICLHCDAVLSPSTSGSFRGARQAAGIAFKLTESGRFRGAFTLIIGSGSDRPKFEGAEVTLALTCERVGFVATVERALTLTPQ